MSTKLTQLPRIQILSKRVTSILGCNPSPMTLLGTNTYLVGSGKDRILIDTGEKNIPEYCNLLKSVLDRTSAAIKCIIITHWHHDHVGGLSAVRDLVKQNVPAYKFNFPPNTSRKGDNFDIHYVADGHVFEAEGARLTAIHNPGHTDDHMILWLEEEKAVFSADSVLGEGTTTFENLHLYMRSLQAIKEMNAEVIYPGHGPVVKNPTAHVNYYISHRLEREEQIKQLLSQHGAMSAADIVQILYKDYPAILHETAARVILLHLEKLLFEGTVICLDETQDLNSKWRLKITSAL